MAGIGARAGDDQLPIFEEAAEVVQHGRSNVMRELQCKIWGKSLNIKLYTFGSGETERGMCINSGSSFSSSRLLAAGTSFTCSVEGLGRKAATSDA